MACQPHMCYHFASFVFLAGYKSGELLIPNKATLLFSHRLPTDPFKGGNFVLERHMLLGNQPLFVTIIT